jgi:hypothetical protein
VTLPIDHPLDGRFSSLSVALEIKNSGDSAHDCDLNDKRLENLNKELVF